MPDGPERAKKWREAAAAYKVALDAAPDRDEAPEAAMNGAYAYKQVGEYDKAIGMYELFISRYGNEQTLNKLQNGDAKAKPPTPAQPKKYEERVKYLQGAYDALAGAYVLFFNYPRAAETYDKISNNTHFAQADRRNAARQALSLYASLGDRGGMTRARERFQALGASPKEIAEADFIVASAELKRWDQYSGDEGANANARRGAQRAMDDYYTANKGKDAAAQYVVQAAYYSAKTRKAVPPATRQMVGQHDRSVRQVEALGRPARAARTARSVHVRRAWPRRPSSPSSIKIWRRLSTTSRLPSLQGHFRRGGRRIPKGRGRSQEALRQTAARGRYLRLARVDHCSHRPQGSLYDSLRTGLYNTRAPQLKIFDAKTEAILKKAETATIRTCKKRRMRCGVKVQNAWRDRRDQELNSADQIMVDRYGNAVVLAKRYSVSNPEVTRAIRRLAFFTDVIGEAKMQQYTSTIKDLNYSAGMFPRMRPGQASAAPAQGLPPPLPAFVQ